jgi:sugar phosphate isomerase/epimerase
MTKGTDKMLAGISTACFYPQKTEDALRDVAALGVQSVEIFLNSFSELEEAYLKNLRKIADEGGVKVLSVHPFTCGMEPMFFFSHYDRRFDDGAELYRRYYNAANLLGADIVVFHGNTRLIPIEDALYFERFSRLMDDAGALGVHLCQENVSRCTSHSSVFLHKMSLALPKAHFVFDVKQAVRSGEEIDAYIRAIGTKIAHIHISDHNTSQDCLIPGKGTLNIANFLINMSKNGFSGGVVVELYRENFGTLVDIYRGYQHILSAFPQ